MIGTKRCVEEAKCGTVKDGYKADCEAAKSGAQALYATLVAAFALVAIM